MYDQNIYVLGEMGGRNVVITVLPEIGNNGRDGGGLIIEQLSVDSILATSRYQEQRASSRQ